MRIIVDYWWTGNISLDRKKFLLNYPDYTFLHQKNLYEKHQAEILFKFFPFSETNGDTHKHSSQRKALARKRILKVISRGLGGDKLVKNRFKNK